MRLNLICAPLNPNPGFNHCCRSLYECICENLATSRSKKKHLTIRGRDALRKSFVILNNQALEFLIIMHI